MIFNQIRDKLTIGLIVAAVVMGAIAIALLLIGCGGEDGNGLGGGDSCAGTVIKTYNEYQAGVGIQSGGITIPTGNTKYYIAVKRSDGTTCSKRLSKSEWLGITEGDTYG